MAMCQLILQHSKQICNDVQSLCEQTDSLIHFQVASHSLVHWFKLRFGPEELWTVEDRPLQMNVDPQDE